METTTVPFSITDTTGVTSKPRHKTGNPSKSKRIKEFRAQKNQASDDAILAGVFARLKIADPTSISSIPIANEIHPATVPICFNTLPEYVDRVWDTMEAIGTRPFSSLNTLENKNIFKKGMQILAEVKVCYAQRAHSDKPDEELNSKKLYSLEELQDLNNMAETLPYPLALYLESIGNTIDRKQIITPLLAETPNVAASGAITYAPRQLLPLLNLLRHGIQENDEVHQLALHLNELPSIIWEAFDGPAIPPNVPPRMVRLTEASYDFWTQEDDADMNRHIRWTDYEYRIFRKLVQSMSSKKGFNIPLDLSSGQGSLAQIVQTTNWSISRTTEWYAMTDLPEYDQKLGSAFAFCNYRGQHVQPSRFRGNFTTSYWRGEITPRRVINAILAGQE